MRTVLNWQGVAKSPEKTKEEFVFGQNLEQRVIKTDPSAEEHKEDESKSECLSPSGIHRSVFILIFYYLIIFILKFNHLTITLCCKIIWKIRNGLEKKGVKINSENRWGLLKTHIT